MMKMSDKIGLSVNKNIVWTYSINENVLDNIGLSVDKNIVWTYSIYGNVLY